MADAKRSAAAKKGWANHCAGTSRRQLGGGGTKPRKAQPRPKAKTAASSARPSKYDRLSYEQWYAQVRAAATAASNRAENRGDNGIRAIMVDPQVRKLRQDYPRYAAEERRRTRAFHGRA